MSAETPLTSPSRLNQLYAEIDWLGAKASDTISAYEGFLKKHGQSKYAEQAQTRNGN